MAIKSLNFIQIRSQKASVSNCSINWFCDFRACRNTRCPKGPGVPAAADFPTSLRWSRPSRPTTSEAPCPPRRTAETRRKRTALWPRGCSEEASAGASEARPEFSRTSTRSGRVAAAKKFPRRTIAAWRVRPSRYRRTWIQSKKNNFVKLRKTIKKRY